ncbi:MAG: hypothetical protein QM802_10105 [Agriterribacter sp.]
MGNNSLHLSDSWDKVKEKLKENDHRLTDEDLQYTPGNANALLERLSGKLNRSKEAVKDLVESISANDGKAS